MATPFLTKEDILTKNEEINKVIPVEVPEWNGTVGLRVMSQTERDAFDTVLMDSTKKVGKETKIVMKGMKALLVSGTLCDDKGKRIFTKEEIQEMPCSPIERLYMRCQELNGMTDDALKGAVKN